MLLEWQDCCIINGDNTTIYFKLQKGHPVSTSLFIFEIVFILIKTSKGVI